MNPQSPEAQQGMQLPAPMEQAPLPGVPAENVPQAPEQPNPQVGERAPAQNAAAAAIPGLPLPIPPVQTAQPIQGAVPLTTPTATLDATDDGDLIEKEWVNKAKQIVEHTRDDPYKQSEELTVVKVDYMKKRYNKTIKLNK